MAHQLSVKERKKILTLAQRHTAAYDALIQEEAELAAAIRRAEPSLTRSQALIEAARILKSPGLRDYRPLTGQ